MLSPTEKSLLQKAVDLLGYTQDPQCVQAREVVQGVIQDKEHDDHPLSKFSLKGAKRA